MPISKNGLQQGLGLFLALTAGSSVAWAQAQYVTPFTFTTIAGAAAAGSIDGASSVATFARPAGLAVDKSGDVFVADTDNNTIREITPQGTVSTYSGSAAAASSGSANYLDGTLSQARYLQPHAIVIDALGDLYIADSGNDVIRKIDTLGNVTTFAGTATVPGYADGTGTAAKFNTPEGLAIDSAGNLYVADTGNNTIRKITTGGVVTTLAGSTSGVPGSANGTGTAALFSYPRGIALDSANNLYVADTNNDTIRKITPAGVVTTLAGVAGAAGDIDGAATVARFNTPTALVTDPSGNLYVADLDNNAIREVSVGGIVSTITDQQHSPATLLSGPDGLAIGSTGTLYAADLGDNAIYSLSLGTSPSIALYAGVVGNQADLDGTGAAARLTAPYAMTLGSDGNLHIAEFASGILRQVTPAGVVTTSGQLQVKPFTTAPGFVAIAAGNQSDYYLSDEVNKVVYHLTSSGSAITVGDQNDYLATSVFGEPEGLVVSPTGTFYLADAGNSAIYQGNAVAQPTVYAGSAGTAGTTNGALTASRFNAPSAVAQDVLGNLYVADTGNHLIRKITPAGVVSTYAGNGTAGTQDGQATSVAEFISPTTLAVDNLGNLYVFDQGAYTIRLVTASTGMVSTIGGLVGVPGGSDGTGPLALFNQVGSMAVDNQGNLYVSDGVECVVKVGRLSATLTAPVIYEQPVGLTLAPGASLLLSVAAGGPNLAYQWYLNGAPISGATGSTYTKASVTTADGGSYTVTISNPYGTVTSSAAMVTVAATTSTTTTGGGTTTSGGVTTVSAPSSLGKFGGGAPSVWFVLALAGLALVRVRFRPARCRV